MGRRSDQVVKMKVAFLFPGQGSQIVGMGKEFYENYECAKTLFEKANSLLEPEFSSLVFNGPQEKLNLTENTQPSILTTSIAAFECLMSQIRGNLEPAYVAGHSLGEYSAYVAAGSITFEDAVVAVRKRAKFMQEAVKVGEGAMAALIGIEYDAVEKVCEEASKNGIVVPANDNAPGQIVIAGQKEAVKTAVELAKQNGCKKAVFLPVSAPFHSPLMKPAREKMENVLKEIHFSNPNPPCVANVTARAVFNSEEARELLIKQIDSPVKWRETLIFLKESGVDTLVEIGPQTVLLGLAKRVSKDWKLLNVEDLKSLEDTVITLLGGSK